MKALTNIIALLLTAGAVQAQQSQPTLLATYQLGPDFGVFPYTIPERENAETLAQIDWGNAPLFPIGKIGRPAPVQPAIKIGISFAF